MKTKEEIKEVVMFYDSKYNEGLLTSEMLEILKILEFDETNFSMERFSDSLCGNTCIMRGGKIVNYLHDVMVAILCGYEDRSETIFEFD